MTKRKQTSALKASLSISRSNAEILALARSCKDAGGPSSCGAALAVLTIFGLPNAVYAEELQASWITSERSASALGSHSSQLQRPLAAERDSSRAGERSNTLPSVKVSQEAASKDSAAFALGTPERNGVSTAPNRPVAPAANIHSYRTNGRDAVDSRDDRLRPLDDVASRETTGGELRGEEKPATDRSVSQIFVTKSSRLSGDARADAPGPFVAYDSAAQRSITFGGLEGTVLSNVAAGTRDLDAVNTSQLKTAGLAIDSYGNVISPVVSYDDRTKHLITLRGGIQGTRLANLAKGRRDMEAVNVSQLREAGITIDSSGNAANTLVTYDDINKERMTLRGDANGTLLSNVAKGRADSDAVNVRQLKDAGLTLDASGNALNALVSYDDAQKNQITFGGTAGTILSKVAQGKADTDAVNIRQLKNAGLTLDSNGDATNTLVAYDTLSNDRISLGGSKGTIISNVKSGVADTDAVNVSQLKSNGLIGAGGAALSAVVYDTLPDGSPNPGSVTLGGASAPAPVALRNVAAGRVKEGSTDAVNGDQLYQTVKIVDDLQSVGAFKYFSTNSTLGAAQALGPDALAIGGEALASGSNSVALGTHSLADRANSVSVGSKGQERQITNVKAGTADTDAVNVAQLKSTGVIDSMGNPTAALTYDKTTSGATDFASVTLGNGIEGGSTLHNVASGMLVNDAVNVGQLNNAVGQLSNAISKVTNTTAVSTAFFSADGNASRDAAVSSGTHAIAAGASALASGENTVAVGAGATASADNSVALGAGSVANRANSVSVGSESGQRQITSVAAGTAGTDAVNLDQLNRVSTNSVAQAASYTDQRFNNAQQQIRDLDRDTRKGIAAASALNVVTPYLPGRTALNAGIAAYRGQAALGIGVSRWNEKGNLNLNAGVSTSGGNSTIVRAGIGYVFGG